MRKISKIVLVSLRYPKSHHRYEVYFSLQSTSSSLSSSTESLDQLKSDSSSSTSHHYNDKRGENFSGNHEIFASQDRIICFYSGKQFKEYFDMLKKVIFIFGVLVRRSHFIWCCCALALANIGPSCFLVSLEVK